MNTIMQATHGSVSTKHESMPDWCGWGLTEWRIKNNADDEYNYASSTWVRINEAWEHAILMRLRFDKTKDWLQIKPTWQSNYHPKLCTNPKFIVILNETHMAVKSLFIQNSPSQWIAVVAGINQSKGDCSSALWPDTNLPSHP